MAAPPPYQLDSKVAEASGLSDKACALALFIFEIIAFAYGADRNALLKAYTSSSGADPVPSFDLRHTKEERENYLALSKTIKETQERVQRNQLCSIPQSSYDTIYTDLILPCAELKVKAAYVAEWLHTYHVHEFNPKQRMKAFKKAPFGFGWWHGEFLTRGLVAADVYVEYMAPNENTRLLLGEAIAKFGDKRMSWSENDLRGKRNVNPTQNAIAMIEVVLKKARKVEKGL
jgi:hypothetical protein